MSSVSLSLAPLAEQNEVVLVGLVVTNPKLTAQNEWVFKYWPSPENEVSPVMQILKELKVKEPGILYLNDEYGTSVFRLLKQEFERNGGTVRSETFEPAETDYRKQIANLKELEAILSVGFDSHLQNVLGQLKADDFKGFILGSNAASGPYVRSIPEANGIYVPAPVIYNENFLFAREVKDKYQDRFGRPFSHYAANGYDFLKILSGLLTEKEVSRGSVKRLLEQGFIYSGVFGSLELEPGDHDITFALYPARIVEGEVRYMR